MNLTETLCALAISAVVAGVSVKSVGYIEDARALNLSVAVKNLELAQQHREAFYGSRTTNIADLRGYVVEPQGVRFVLDGVVSCATHSDPDVIRKAQLRDPSRLTLTVLGHGSNAVPTRVCAIPE